MVFTDQNFPPYWRPAGESGCIAICRLENPTLHELVDLCLEMLDGSSLPDGSVLLIGSAAYLHRLGVQSYAHDWTRVVARLGRRWPNVRVSPLIPIFSEDAPGGGSQGID